MGTKTIAQMQQDVNTALPTNGTGAITAAILRSTIDNLISQIFDDIGLRGGAADFNNQELLRATITPNGEASPVLLTQFLAGSRNASYSVINLQDYLRFQPNTRVGRRTALSNAIAALFALTQGGGILDCSGVEIELDSPYSMRDSGYAGSADVKVAMTGDTARNKVIWGLNVKKVDGAYVWQENDYITCFGSATNGVNLSGFKLLYPRINMGGGTTPLIGLCLLGYLRVSLVGEYIFGVGRGKAVASIKYNRTTGIGQNSTGIIAAATNTISAISKANPGVITYSGTDNWANDDQFMVVGGDMTQLNNRIFMVGSINVGAKTFQIRFTSGNNVDTTSYTTYTGGGTVIKLTDLANHGLASYDAGLFSSAGNFKNTISAISKANPGVITYTGSDNWANGDMFMVNGGEMVELYNRIFKVGGLNVGAKTFNILNLDGGNVNTSSYTTYVSGGDAVQYIGSMGYYLEDGDCTIWGGIYGSLEHTVKSVKGGCNLRGLHPSPDGFVGPRTRCFWLTAPRLFSEIGSELDKSYIFIENSTDNLQNPGETGDNFSDIEIRGTNYNGAVDPPVGNGLVTFVAHNAGAKSRGLIIAPAWVQANTGTTPVVKFNVQPLSGGWWNGPGSKRANIILPDSTSCSPGRPPAGMFVRLAAGGFTGAPAELLYHPTTGALLWQDNGYIDNVQAFAKVIANDLYIGRLLNTSNSSVTIDSISKANPAVVGYTGSDIFVNGEIVWIADAQGMVEINGGPYTIANVNTGANTFELAGVNSTNFGTYTAGTALIIIESLRWRFNANGTLQPAYNNLYDFGTSAVASKDLYMAGKLSRGATQLLTARQTGWATSWTGAADRSTFDKDTITLPQLAQRMIALLTDLETHGIIGA